MLVARERVLTAHGLLVRIKALGPTVEDGELLFVTDPSPDLDSALGVLHTGVRAQLVSRRWFGCEAGTGRVSELNPMVPIPPGISLLCVEGDERWDRIDPAARIDLPRLFATAPAPGPSRRG